MRLLLLATLFIIVPFVGVAQTQPAPALVLKDLSGRAIRLSEYQGKVVLLNFWATWCPPCRAEMPELVRMQREYGGRGLQVIGITYPPERRARVRQFARRLKVNYPIALGTQKTKTLFDGGQDLPLTVVIDRQGFIREVIRGILLPDEFEQKIKPLLRLGQTAI